ncbi:MAG: carbamoyltransferase C-terminal domain-containing protein [Planctomycetota bacterium]
MRVLGIHDAFDAGAALVIDGELRAAVNEERLNREKNFHEQRGRLFGILPAIKKSAYPRLSIERVLEMEGLQKSDIDAIVLPHARPSEFLTSIPAKFFRSQFGRAILNLPLIGALCSLYWMNKRQLLRSTFKQLREHGFSTDKVHFIGHHHSHASGAYRTSGWDDALVIVADLEGDLTSTTVWRARGNDLELLDETMFPFASMGAFYGNATASIGFRKHVDECKVMGLAAYGDPKCLEEIEHGLTWDEERSRLISKKPLSFKRFVAELAVGYEKKDVASSAQHRLEEVLVPFVEYWMQKTGCHRVCYGGGVAHNVIANQRLQEIPSIEGLHIFPHAGDGGLACGAALEHWYQHAEERGSSVSYELQDAYLGPEYGEDAIRAALEKYKLPLNHSDSIGDELGALLADGHVCGIYQGRMEIGPRALGNRSIVSSPTGSGPKDKVNNKVKFREAWRPFALSCLAECQDEYLMDATAANFMLLGFQVVPEKLEEVRSAAHVDGSTRPQTVSASANPRYHAAISAFREHTGVGGILNTSLNRRGEPICCTPEDAIECFLGSDMDAIILGDYLLTKKDVSKDQLTEFEALEKDVAVTA